MAKKPTPPKEIAALKHPADKRINIPSAEQQALIQPEHEAPRALRYPRNTDLDPQLVWRGKDSQDWSDLVVNAPPLYVQEHIHPQALIGDLLQVSVGQEQATGPHPSLFADFNGLPPGAERTDFYQHEQNWSNRMILGDSLQVMASLAEREGLRGKVQCIYLDPPYGIKFNSNFQWSTTSRDVKDGNREHITREPEQVKAFRDTWRDGVHSYLTYLRDRLTVARDLLTESGSIFVQIGDENVHRVRCVLDEVFGEENSITIITIKKTAGLGKGQMAEITDFILWFAKNKETLKRRLLFTDKEPENDDAYSLVKETVGHYRRVANNEKLDPNDYARFQILLSAGRTPSCVYPVTFYGQTFEPTAGRSWSTNPEGMQKLIKSDRVAQAGRTINYVRFVADNPVNPVSNLWADTASGSGMDKTYVVQTSSKVIERCILMATDPGDLVLDPTCGSGTTAYVAEQWGRRWITCDTSRVALALARTRLMGARYPYYILADSPAGQLKEATITRSPLNTHPTYNNLKHGFVYARVPHITLKSIANNTEIDSIWDKWQVKLEPLRMALNQALTPPPSPLPLTGEGGKTATPPPSPLPLTREGGKTATPPPSPPPLDRRGGLKGEGSQRGGVKSTSPLSSQWEGGQGGGVPWQEWEIPRESNPAWPPTATTAHAAWWQARIARQKEIDASIAAKAEFEYLYDQPYDDKTIVRVAGPFTVDSLSPHRMLGIDENDELIDPAKQSFAEMILENLRTTGVQQAHKEDRIEFTEIKAWPGDLVCGEGWWTSQTSQTSQTGQTSQTSPTGQPEPPPTRAAIFIGPEFGTVQRADLVAAAHEAAESGFNMLIACAFNYEANATEFTKLGKVQVLKARMNADLHMAADLKNTGSGNLFVIFGEPDITLLPQTDGNLRVKINGVDIFKPQTGEVVSHGPEGIACWFIDTDYNSEQFFVRHAYFLGANDPYSALKTTLKAEINAEVWATLHSDTSRPFPKPKTGRIAVKVVNHLGDEVLKVFKP